MGLERITPTQVMMLLVVSRLALTLVFWSPHPVSQYDEWWSLIFATATGVVCLWVLSFLWRRYPQKTLAQILEAVLGRVLGKAVSLLYVLFFLLTFTLTLRLSGEVFIFALLPKTPITVVIGAITLLGVFGVKAGLEVLGRSVQIIFPMLVGILGLVFVLLLKDIHFEVLWPPRVIHTGLVPHMQDWVAIVARTVEYAWILMLIPFVRERKRLLRAAAWAHVWLAAVWIPMAVMMYGILGPDIEPYQFPFYTVTQMIQVAEFVERLEGVLLTGWVFGFFIRAALLLWAGALGTAQLLGLRDYRPLVLPLAALGMSYSLPQADSLREMMRYLRPEVFIPFCLTFVLVIPLVVLGVDLVGGLFRDVGGETM